MSSYSPNLQSVLVTKAWLLKSISLMQNDPFPYLYFCGFVSTGSFDEVVVSYSLCGWHNDSWFGSQVKIREFAWGWLLSI